MKQSMVFAVYGCTYVPQMWEKHFCSSSINRLYYIHSGSGGYMLHGKKYPFEKGKIYFISSSADAVAYSEESDPIFHSYCDFEILPTIITPKVLCFSPEENSMDRVAAEVFNEGCRRATERRNKGISFVLEEKEEALFRSSVLYLTERAKEIMSEDIIDDEEILKAIEYMHKNIDKKITVEKIAADSFMSDGGFIKKFKKCVGVTPYVYLRNIRLNMADYLKELGYTLEYIAEKVGYSDAVSLNHAMRRNKSRKD